MRKISPRVIGEPGGATYEEPGVRTWGLEGTPFVRVQARGPKGEVQGRARELGGRIRGGFRPRRIFVRRFLSFSLPLLVLGRNGTGRVWGALSSMASS